MSETIQMSTKRKIDNLQHIHIIESQEHNNLRGTMLLSKASHTQVRIYNMCPFI